MMLTWLALLGLLALELAATLAHLNWLAALLAPLMIALVATVFMEIRAETPLGRIVAVAGLFWLAIMLTLGSLDAATRITTPAPQLTTSAHPPPPKATPP